VFEGQGNIGLVAQLVEVAPVVRPPLKWAGGKRWLVCHIAPLWKSERHRRLVEPLSGGLAGTLGLMPERALLNDINPHTMNFYQWLKKDCEFHYVWTTKAYAFTNIARAAMSLLLSDAETDARLLRNAVLFRRAEARDGPRRD
jgi:site-specific DNA-adenine methylase